MTERRLKPHMSRSKLHKRIIEYFFSVILAIGVLAPVLWMFLTSIMYPKDLTAHPLNLIPSEVTFSRYAEVFASNTTSDPAYIFRVALKNSCIIAVFVTLLSLVIGTIAAYGFARLRFRGRGVLMMLVLFTYMLPPAALVIPLYRIYNSLGLLDKKWPMVILYLSFIIPFIIWVMQGFFGSISNSYEEAAQIDGATRLQTLIYIFFPIARPGAIATGILAFLMSWDEFFYSLIFTSSLNAKTMPVAIAEFNGKFTIDYGMISVAGILGSLIPVLVTLIFQKYIVMGMTTGGVKE
ncbi:Trehalose transport system permease protein SugB [bioreactor metagenome]|uniref:Trehalose transport system permease protein SugB n=1 Tax=bioreactor metagenome TaxID=1076179 RepID=A0A645BRL6_9ZZZZ|nr:carbohydrate ABC transporter permease [Oscillibacter sp.]